jgi:predicted CoA-binding protein
MKENSLKKEESRLDLKDDPIFRILSRFKRITVVGLSPDFERPSYEVTEYMITEDYEINGVRPDTDEILGLDIYPSLKEVPGPLEIVNVFRASKHIPALVDELIEAGGAKVLWLQEGVAHPEAEQKARKAGIFVISNRCIMKEHHRVFHSHKKSQDSTSEARDNIKDDTDIH